MEHATIALLLHYGRTALEGKTPSAALDALVLLCFVLNKDKVHCIAHKEETVAPELVEKYHHVIDRRAKGEPVPYILGFREFFGRDFEVSPSVLIPRPETEVLVERAIAHLEDMSDPCTVLDLGTGSGCIAVSIVAEMEKRGRKLEVTAVDISSNALSVAKRNAERLIESASISFVESAWFSTITPGKRFDLIVSNPPYIAVDDPEVGPETRFEPRTALYAGSDGLDDYRVLCTHLYRYLTERGVFLGEIGATQQDALRALLSGECGRYYKEPVVYVDLAGRDRVIELVPRPFNFCR